MADDLSKTGKQDDNQINIHQKHEVAYWTKTLGISEEKLKQAVKAAGPFVINVKNWLKKNP